MPEFSPQVWHLLSLIPLLGLGVMAAALFALTAKKDRWIIIGSLLTIFSLAGVGLAIEYGGQIKSRLAPDQELAIADHRTGPYATTGDEASIPEPALEPDAPAEDQPPQAETPADRTSRLIPLEPTPQTPKRPTWEPGRKGIVRTDSPIVTPKRETEPTRTPAPAERPTAIAPRPTSEPTPAPTARTDPAPTYTPPPAPARRTAPEPAGGKGNLVVRIKGPILETAKEPSRAAHIMVIVGGKTARTATPNRVSESYKDNDPSQPLMAITYFWEDVTMTFNNLPAGWQVVQVNISLDTTSANRAQMTNPAFQDRNDYNGTVEIKPGQTTTIEFTTRNWHTGQLSRPRIY